MNLQRIISGIEYGLGALFVWGGFNTVFADPLEVHNLFYFLLAGNKIVIIFYALLFAGTGAAMIISKIRKRKKLHGYSLLSMYLTCTYVMILSLALVGPHPGLITTVVVGVLSAFLWLRWKFQTEYIDIRQFHEDIHKIREEDYPER